MSDSSRVSRTRTGPKITKLFMRLAGGHRNRPRKRNRGIINTQSATIADWNFFLEAVTSGDLFPSQRVLTPLWQECANETSCIPNKRGTIFNSSRLTEAVNTARRS